MFIGQFAYEWVGKLSVFLINLYECNSLFFHLFCAMMAHDVRHRLQFILDFVVVIVVISLAASAVDDAIVF